MLAGFFLALREGLEAALIMGIVLAALRKMGQPQFGAAVWRGAGAAAVVSLAAGLVLSGLGAGLEGRAEEIFEGTAMLAAAGLLTWMILWMQRQAAALRQNLEGEVRQALQQPGSRRALFGLAFLAVGREGLELVLFLIAAGLAGGAWQSLAGAALGLGSAALLGWGVYTSSYHLDLRQFFRVTNLLLMLFAAGLVGHGVHEFVEAGLLPALRDPLYDVNFLLNEKHVAGQLLTALFGYNANPTLSETLAYALYLLAAALLWTGVAPRPLSAARVR